MIKNILLVIWILSMGASAGKNRPPNRHINCAVKQTKKHSINDLDEAILENYTRQVTTTFKSLHQSNSKLQSIQELYTPESHRKVETDYEKFKTLFESFTLYDDQYQTLQSKQKQIEMEHNTTQQDLQSQFDQISQQIQSYQSKLNDIHKIQEQSNAQINLFQNTISQIDHLIKKRGSVHLNSDELIKLFNHANRALALIDTNLQLFCTNQGKGSHMTIETYLNGDHDSHKTTVCSNTRVRHIRDTFNRIVHILNESQQETTDLSRQEQRQEEQIRMEMEYIVTQQNDIVDETKIKLGELEQKILSLKTSMSQLTTQKRNILIRWESMVDDSDFVTRRFSHGPLQTYYIIEFYVDTVLPLLIEQRVRWYVSCYSEGTASLYNPFVKLNFTWMKWQLFHESDCYLADRYNASIDYGLKAKYLSLHSLQVLYEKRNQKLHQCMEQIKNAVKHTGTLAYPVETILGQIQEQLNLILGSLTLPTYRLVPKIHDGWRYTSLTKIDCPELDSSNASEIVFQDYQLLGDMLDTRRHMYSFVKKQYDVALYYQKSMNQLKQQNGHDLNMGMKTNLLQWSILHNEAYLLFLKVKAFGIDSTDEMMKSAFGLVTHRVEHLNEKEIDSIQFYQQIVNKTYIKHWRNSRVADMYQEFLNDTLPFLATM